MARPSHLELRHIFEQAPILVVGIAPDGTTIFANPMVEKITGYSPVELLGKNCWRILCPDKGLSQVTRLLRRFQKAEVRERLVVLTTKSGEQHHISWNSTNIYDTENRLRVSICAGRDVTERVMLKQRADQEKTNLYRMLTGLGAGVALLHKNLKIVWANERYTEWFGDIEKIRGKYCYCLFPRREPIPGYRPVLESKKIGAVFEGTAFTKDGRERLFRIVTSPMGDDHGKAIKYLVLTIDVTEQKELEQRLLQTERMATIGEIATVMAHEIRNPLTPIGGFARYLKKQIPHDPVVQKSVDAIIREANRLEHMVDGVEDFARTSKINYVKTDLNKLVEKCLTLLDSEIKANRITMDANLSNILPQVPMDPDLIGRVLIHLLRNSVQAMPDGGHLTVTTSRKRRFAEVRVTDTGPGIEKGDVNQIFQAFFSKRGRLGIGLTISSRIVQDHGGRISAEEGKGKGAVFFVELPLKTISFPLTRPQPLSLLNQNIEKKGSRG
ncbi:MAG: PAS domain S-box protein [Proteobacteria bacterium]|nr:PAS domain S-box protein [Pseudomonadota bacterium]NIS69281.1 PAS domain S-box protein [Pseudomonadota bacterium]